MCDLEAVDSKGRRNTFIVTLMELDKQRGIAISEYIPDMDAVNNILEQDRKVISLRSDDIYNSSMVNAISYFSQFRYIKDYCKIREEIEAGFDDSLLAKCYLRDKSKCLQHHDIKIFELLREKCLKKLRDDTYRYLRIYKDMEEITYVTDNDSQESEFIFNRMCNFTHCRSGLHKVFADYYDKYFYYIVQYISSEQQYELGLKYYLAYRGALE